VRRSLPDIFAKTAQLKDTVFWFRGIAFVGAGRQFLNQTQLFVTAKRFS